MSTESVASPPITATPADHERLLDAARAALALLDRMDTHLPEGYSLGGEGKVRRMLREAVRSCSYEVRECEFCDGGTTHAPTTHPMERPRTVACGECGGSGERRVYSYGKPRRRR